MKILGKMLIVLTVIALVLVPVAGCTGPTGSTGPAGSTGPEGPAGSEGPAGPEGPAGAAGQGGSIWYTGSGAPSSGIGSDGDLYLNTGDGGVWQKSGGAWSEVNNLTGPAGAPGSTGSVGPPGGPGSQGPAGPPRQIVVTWDPTWLHASQGDFMLGASGSMAIVDAYRTQWIRIKGSGFEPGQLLQLTICEDNLILDLYTTGHSIISEGYVTVNDHGAFEVLTIVHPAASYGPASIKAWRYSVVADIFYDLQATWPLDIVYEEDFWESWWEWWSIWGTPQIVVGEENRVVIGFVLGWEWVDPDGEGSLEPIQVVVSITPTYETKYMTIWQANVGDTVIIKGSGFTPLTTVWITICTANQVWAEVVVDAHGAFEVVTTVPEWVTLELVTVRVWVNAVVEEDHVVSGWLRATWPLDIPMGEQPA